MLGPGRNDAVLASVLLASALVLAGCRDERPELVVVNESVLPMTDVVLSGTGFEAKKARQEPGETWSVRVTPKGESSLAVRFQAGDRTVQKGGLAYLEGHWGYTAEVRVHKDLSVTCAERYRD